MRIPLSWVREYAPIDAVGRLSGRESTEAGAAEVARRLTAAGLEVESADEVGHDVTGVLVGEVVEIEELTGFKKPIRFCRVTTGDSDPPAVGRVSGQESTAVGRVSGQESTAVGR